jgi:lipopolysaccharide export system permease protein
MIRIPLLQRVLFREMALITGICLGAFLCIILLGRLLQLRDLFLAQGATFMDLVQLFVYLSPLFLILLVPVSCMVGLFLTLLRMSSDNELLSLRAGGLSFAALLPAPIVLCLLCSGLTLWLSLAGISWGMDNFRRTVVDLAKHKTAISLQPGVFNSAFPHLTVYTRQADPVSGELRDVFAQDSSKPGAPTIVMAPIGKIDSDPDLGHIFVRMENGHAYREEGGEISVISFERYLLSLDTTRLLGGFELKDKVPKEMSWQDLRDLFQGGAAEKSLNFQRKVHIELHKRLALPVACLVLGLFALPLAFFFQGMKREYGLVMALGAFFLYYSLFSIGMSLAESGMLPPAVSLWVPNALFLMAALGGIWLAVEDRQWELRLPKYFLRREKAAGRKA